MRYTDSGHSKWPYGIKIRIISYEKRNGMAASFRFLASYEMIKRNCGLTMGRNVVWTTKARSGQSYNTKCVWYINIVLSILFIWAYDEYCIIYETNTTNVSSEMFVVPAQIYLRYTITTKDAYIEGKRRMLIAVRWKNCEKFVSQRPVWIRIWRVDGSARAISYGRFRVALQLYGPYM